MAHGGGKYNGVDVTGNDAEMQKVILHQRCRIDSVKEKLDGVASQTDSAIASSEQLLRSMGRSVPQRRSSASGVSGHEIVTLRPWHEISAEAESAIPGEVAITDLLSDTEIFGVERRIAGLRDEFDLQHKLDWLDYGISGMAGTLAALVDIFLVKIPSSKGLMGAADTKGGALSDFFRNHLKSKFTPQEISDLEKNNWVPYDASTSKGLADKVPGLGPRSHRFQSLGHDPILGFIFGVADIMRGTMTAIGSDGRLIIQKVLVPESQQGLSLFEAIIRQIGHLKSDIGTSAGLPVPFMPLLELIQVGSIGDKGQTVGELSRAMYAQGYNFGHFLAMSVPVLMIEVLVRTFYFLKRIKEGHGFLESIPFNIPGQPHKPKLQTMLFLAHTIATAANAGKVIITENPLSINFPQWIVFVKSALSQFKWVAWQKENERLAHTQKKLDEDWDQVNKNLMAEWSFVEVPVVVQ